MAAETALAGRMYKTNGDEFKLLIAISLLSCCIIGKPTKTNNYLT